MQKARSLLWDFLEASHAVCTLSQRHSVAQLKALPQTHVRRDDVQTWGDPCLVAKVVRTRMFGTAQGKNCWLGYTFGLCVCFARFPIWYNLMFLAVLFSFGYWTILEYITHGKEDLQDFCTFALPQFRRDWLPNPTNGIINGFGFGQSDFMWYLRLLPRVKVRQTSVILAASCAQVTPSPGGVCCTVGDGWFARLLWWGKRFSTMEVQSWLANNWRPDLMWLHQKSHEQLETSWNNQWQVSHHFESLLQGWFHCDQNAFLGVESRGRVCVQGLVTLRQSDQATGGLVVVPGSHRDHENLCKRSLSDWRFLRWKLKVIKADFFLRCKSHVNTWCLCQVMFPDVHVLFGFFPRVFDSSLFLKVPLLDEMVTLSRLISTTPSSRPNWMLAPPIQLVSTPRNENELSFYMFLWVFFHETCDIICTYLKLN